VFRGLRYLVDGGRGGGGGEGGVLQIFHAKLTWSGVNFGNGKEHKNMRRTSQAIRVEL